MAEKKTLLLKDIKRVRVQTRIVGITPLIQHQWSEKAKRELRDKHAGKKTKDREVRDPAAEASAATYRTKGGAYAIPAMAVKSALISAAHKDIGCEKTLVRKALFLECKDPTGMIEIECDEPVLREDCVRVGMSGTDLRYRPEFHRWACTITWIIDEELLTQGDLINLINRAGFGVGIGEWRPEKGGEYGRFEFDATQKLVSETVKHGEL